MAAGMLPSPGTKNYYGEDIGPCADECKHVDCKATRKQAAAPCRECRKPIGFDTRFYNTGDSVESALVHAACVEGR